MQEQDLNLTRKDGCLGSLLKGENILWEEQRDRHGRTAGGMFRDENEPHPEDATRAERGLHGKGG